MLPTIRNCVILALGCLLAIIGWLRRRKLTTLALAGTVVSKKAKLWANAAFFAGLWCLAEKTLQLVLGSTHAGTLEVELFAPRITFGGFSLSTTVVTTWILMAVTIAVAILIRLIVIPKMEDIPHGIQNVLETAVEAICNYTDTTAGEPDPQLPAYIFTVAVFMIGCAVVELFGVRAPTSDITMTFSMALVTFLLIHYYGIRKKGIKGRIRSMSQPTPFVFVIKVITDIAIPVSMACRLFGNMLGGMIVMDLLYSVMGNAAVGFPSILGLYFNVFHPLIQAYIFVTLTLTFIREAVE